MIKFGTHPHTDKRLAYLALRLALGLNLLFHGLVRFGDRYQPFVNDTVHSFKDVAIPAFLVKLIASLIPISEFVLGLLITAGFQTRLALVGGTKLMLLLLTGMTLLQEWEVVGLQMVYVLFYAALLAFLEFNHYSADRKFRKKD